MQATLNFLRDLSANNNREWFNSNKDRYIACHEHFLAFSEKYIDMLSSVDPSIQGLMPKDCIWRIYRDTRFSNDKRPYKEWFGVFPAAEGGRRSPHAGYYLHIQPGHCMFAGGIWCPDNNLLRQLRNEILANDDEIAEIMQMPQWKKYFGDFDSEYMLKRLPLEFANREMSNQVAEWIKRKAYTFSTPLSDAQICSPDIMNDLKEIAQTAYPMIRFLNYVFE
ncbi:MAG: DUF2461 domain-containing protein [Paludibacteraceae bacterium]|nr:DUF2461 domain-containing protein [Paludibacteraceae bacterium]